MDTTNLNTNAVSTVLNSIEVTNEESFSSPYYDYTNNDLKEQIGSFYQAQNRAVTERDYEALIYAAPKSVSSIRRLRVVKDKKSLKNNLNIYVLGSDSSDRFMNVTYATKENLKNYLNNYRVMTDTINILDAKVINLGINYEIIVDPNYDPYDVLNNTKEFLVEQLSEKMQIGEHFTKNKVYKILRSMKGLLDVTNIEIVNNSSMGYSDVLFDVDANTTDDNRTIICPLNCVFEIKYPTSDIKGPIK